jgi:xylulokinase
MAVSDRPLPNHTFLNYPFVIPGYWYPGTSTKFAASAFNWVRRAFWSDEEVEGIYDLMDQSAGSIPPGSDGLLFHPYLAGEFAPSWDPYLRASFLGIGRDHNRSHFTRAVMEGVGLSVRDALENAIEMGLSIKDIRLIGGGSESQLWSQIMADIINQEIVVPVGNDAAFGAALLAGVAAGIFDSSPETINQLIHFRACHHPEPTSVALYDELFLIYKEAALATRQISHKLHHFQTKLHEENSRASSEIENPDTLSL